MSKKIIFFITLLFFNYHIHANNNFVPGIVDLPVPASFYLENDSSSIYNNGFGRIITASFIGKAKKEDILDFYYKTLPALGWSKQENLFFIRDDESLIIEIIQKNSEELLINFKLTPAK